jgi:prephenate dehydratase
MTKRVAYLGPPGTFAEEAAILHDKTAQLISVPTIHGVAVAVASGMAEEGVVPIENSIEGSVPDTLDLLIHDSALMIREELVLPIEHHLLVKRGTEISDVKVLYSHPQALGQCRQFIERILPKVEVVAALSTASAVQEMLGSSKPAAAIGTRRAAKIYGAEVLAKKIQDRATNVTRFVVLAAEDHPPTGADKTSICFSFAEDRPGVLVEVLQEFSSRGINLAKVESRPTKEVLGRYIFLTDLEGHRDDAKVRELLEAVRGKTSTLKVFGSYPKFKK